jgi:hypothetical protein
MLAKTHGATVVVARVRLKVFVGNDSDHPSGA